MKRWCERGCHSKWVQSWVFSLEKSGIYKTKWIFKFLNLVHYKNLNVNLLLMTILLKPPLEALLTVRGLRGHWNQYFQKYAHKDYSFEAKGIKASVAEFTFCFFCSVLPQFTAHSQRDEQSILRGLKKGLNSHSIGDFLVHGNSKK